MALTTLFPNGKALASAMYVDPLQDGNLEVWDGNVSVSSSGSAIEDGVDPLVKATVRESTATAGKFGLVVINPDGSNISGGGGGGGAVTVADGADVTQGAVADAKVIGDNTGTVSAKLRGFNYYLSLVIDAISGYVRVNVENASLAVTGTFWQATQPVSGPLTDAQLRAVAVPVSAASLPLPTGAATEATLSSLNGKVTAVNTGAVTISAALPAGNNNIGDVDIASIAAGDNNIGNVDVVTLPSIPAGTNNIGDVDVLTLPGIAGTVADDAAESGNPVSVSGLAKSPDGTDPGNVSAEGDRAEFITDLNRRQFVNITHPQFKHKHLDGSSAYTDESIAAAPGAGFQIVITNIIASTGAATALNFFLEEGASKIFGPIYLEAVAGRGFASGPISLPVTANTAVTLTSSAAIAQSFDIDYYIQKV
jgi:hypothetical protein